MVAAVWAFRRGVVPPRGLKAVAEMLAVMRARTRLVDMAQRQMAVLSVWLDSCSVMILRSWFMPSWC